MQMFPEFDYGILGEGEISTIKLLEALGNNTSVADIQGVIYRDGSKIINNGKSPLIRNLDDLPLDAWDLLKGFPQIYKSSVHKMGRLPTTSLISSRGCPIIAGFVIIQCSGVW